MNTDPKYLHSDISDSVLKAFYTVRHLLPYNLALDIYKRALRIEMQSLGLSVLYDKEVEIKYKDKIIGSFVIDFVVNDSIIVTIVNNDTSCKPYMSDAKNHLYLTDYEVCLILNFSVDTLQQHTRIVLTNDLKKKNDFV